LERLYRDRGDRLWRAVLAYSGDPEVASDAVAEAFAQALRRGDAIRDLEAWLWRATFRIAAGDLADRRRRATPPDDPGPSRTTSPSRPTSSSPRSRTCRPSNEPASSCTTTPAIR